MNTVFDTTLEAVDGDRELFLSLVEIFREDLPPALTQLNAALGHGDSQAARGTAHAIKGMVSVFAAPRAAQAALHVEQLPDTQAMAGAMPELQAALSELQTALDAFVTRS